MRFLAFPVRFRKKTGTVFHTPARHSGASGGVALRASSPIGAAGSPQSGVATVLVRKQPRTEIINGWLILIAILGATITVADGLTRGPAAERAASWNGPLEYVPYWGASLLAAVSLPLMFGYGSKARIPASEAVALWFVFCTSAYTRDFSYIRLPGAPFFVTDMVLMILLVSIYLLRRPNGPRMPLAASLLLGMLFLAGMLAAARGFLGNRETILVLRDSALVVYALFLPVGYLLFGSWLAVKRLAVWFLLGTALSVFNGFGWFFAAPLERRFIYIGIYILIALVGTLGAITTRLLDWRIGWTLAGLLCLGLALANSRTLFVALPILVLGILCGTALGRVRTSKVRIVLATLLPASILVGAMALFFLNTEAGRDFGERSAQGLASGVLHPGEDANWQFRLAAWSQAWKRFAEYPAGGEGFGIPFVFEIWDNDPRPHNTFLTVLYKMGLIGFLPLLGLIAHFFWTTLRTIRRNLENRRAYWLWILVITQIAFCIYGAANLLLESPFLASIFWLFMGLGLRMIWMLDLDRALNRGWHGCQVE